MTNKIQMSKSKCQINVKSMSNVKAQMSNNNYIKRHKEVDIIVGV